MSAIIEVIVWSCGNWFLKNIYFLGEYFLKSYFWVVILLNCQHVDIFYGGGNIKKTSYLINRLWEGYITLICCQKQGRKYKDYSTTLFLFSFKVVHLPNLYKLDGGRISHRKVWIRYNVKVFRYQNDKIFGANSIISLSFSQPYEYLVSYKN